MEPSGELQEADEASRAIITGRLVSDLGGPVANATVELRIKPIPEISTTRQESGGLRTSGGSLAGASHGTCTSDQEGRFRLEGEPLAGATRLHLSHPGHVPAAIKVSRFNGTDRDVGKIVLEAGGILSGRVIDRNGAPLAEVVVTAKPASKEGQGFFSTTIGQIAGAKKWMDTSDENGCYRITGLPAGKVNVTAGRPDPPLGRVTDVVIAKGRETKNVDIVMPLGLSITGHVVGTNEVPLPGAQVRATQDSKNLFGNLDEFDLTRFKSGMNAATDEDGRFVIEGLAKGTYELAVRTPTYLVHRLEGVKAGTTDVTVRLEKGGKLYGRVLDAETGQAIEAFALDVKSLHERPVAVNAVELGRGEDNVRITTGGEAVDAAGRELNRLGAYCIDGLAAMEYSMDVKAEGYATDRISNVAVSPGEERFMDIGLWEESTISGRLLTADGESVAEGEVSLQSSSEEAKEISSALNSAGIPLPIGQIWAQVNSASTGEEGDFILEGVREGTYRIVARHKDHMESEPMEVSVARGQHLENIEILLGRAGSVAGTVFGADGEPLPGGLVMVSPGGGLLKFISVGLSGGEKYMMKTDTTGVDGTYRVDGLKPGRYWVRLFPVSEDQEMGAMLNTAMSSFTGGGGPGVERAIVEAGKVTHVDLYEPVPGMITGTVICANTPVPGFRVKLFAGGLGMLALVPVKVAVTDENGAYLMKKVDAGEYELRLEPTGHVDPIQKTVTLDSGRIVMQDLILPAGNVRGRVTDSATGQPVPGIRISLENLRKRPGQQSLFDNFLSKVSVLSDDDDDDEKAMGAARALGIGGPMPVETDSEGRFEILYVGEGEYALTAKGNQYSTERVSPVKVTAGMETPQLDLTVVRGYDLQGTVTDLASGMPVPMCYVACKSIEADKEEEVKALFSKEKGLFRIRGLAPGTYRLNAKKDDRMGQMEITVAKEDLEDLELKIQ